MFRYSIRDLEYILNVAKDLDRVDYLSKDSSVTVQIGNFCAIPLTKVCIHSHKIYFVPSLLKLLHYKLKEQFPLYNKNYSGFNHENTID